MKRTAIVFGKEELAHVNLYGPENFNEADYHGESWGNVAVQLCDNAATELGYEPRTVIVPDYDGATSGMADAMNVLLPTGVWESAKPALEEAGFSFDEPMEPHPGHYGDGNWEGAELLVFKPDWDEEYWLLVLN